MSNVVRLANAAQRTLGTVLPGFDVAGFSGHSLRAGSVTSAADRDADPNRIMDASRQRVAQRIACVCFQVGTKISLNGPNRARSRSAAIDRLNLPPRCGHSVPVLIS